MDIKTNIHIASKPFMLYQPSRHFLKSVHTGIMTVVASAPSLVALTYPQPLPLPHTAQPYVGLHNPEPDDHLRLSVPLALISSAFSYYSISNDVVIPV